MAGKTAVKNNKAKNESHKPVLTDRICTQCNDRIMSNEVSLMKVISFEGAKRSGSWRPYHRKHLPKI